MTRARVLVMLTLGACAPTRDLYVGNDYPPSIDAGNQQLARVDAAPLLDTSLAQALDATAPLLDAMPTPPVLPPMAADAGSVPDTSPPNVPLTCTSMRGNCDNDDSNGCETDLARDPTHCGTCTTVCREPDCGCQNGKLSVVCPPGRADCDAKTSNGCETDINTSMQHCGRCGRLCHTNGHDAIAAVCTAGACKITCQIEPFGQDNCDDNADNGCETQLWTDNQNCGACGVRCTCSNGRCL